MDILTLAKFIMSLMALGAVLQLLGLHLFFKAKSLEIPWSVTGTLLTVWFFASILLTIVFIVSSIVFVFI
mgnify:FL=1